jgi:hypothetical protein
MRFTKEEKRQWQNTNLEHPQRPPVETLGVAMATTEASQAARMPPQTKA